MTGRREILLEGYSQEEVLKLAEGELESIFLTGEPLVFRVGSAEVLGSFRVRDDRFVVELAHIDGGGEGVLKTLWLLAERFARRRGLLHVEWLVHAVACANPNPKLRRVLERLGFEVKDVPGHGPVFHQLHGIEPKREN